MLVPRRYRRLWAERPGFVVLATLVLGVLLVWPVLDLEFKTLELGTEFRYYDYGVYSGTIESWFQGEAIYQPNEDGGYHGSYLYPPITLLAFLPLYVFEFYTAGTLLGVVSLIALWVGVEAVVSTLGYRLRLWERFVLLFALFGFHPLLFTFKMGQVPTLLTAVLCFAFVTMEADATGRRPDGGEAGVGAGGAGESADGAADGSSAYAAVRPYLSGALTTLGSSMKLFYATSGAHMLRDRRRLVGGLATAAGLLVASVAVFGIEVHLNYLDVLAWGKGWGTSPRTPELWMPAYFRPMYVLGALSLPVRILGILGVIGLTLAARGATDATTRRATFALGVAVAPLFAPKAYTQDLVLLVLPAVVLLGVELSRRDGHPWIPVLAVFLLQVHSFGLWLLVHPPDWVPLGELLAASAGWLQPGLWGTLLLVGLAAVRVGAAARWPAALPRP